MNKIDTHQHLLYPDQFDYSWSKDLPTLQGAFHLEDYQAGAADCNIEGTLFMEVDVDAGQRMRKNNTFSQLAADPASKILGIIARVRPEEADFEEQLDLILYPKGHPPRGARGDHENLQRCGRG